MAKVAVFVPFDLIYVVKSQAWKCISSFILHRASWSADNGCPDIYIIGRDRVRSAEGFPTERAIQESLGIEGETRENR